MYRTDWKKDLDKVYEEAIKNWWKTGKPKKSSGINAQISLGSQQKKKKEKQPPQHRE